MGAHVCRRDSSDILCSLGWPETHRDAPASASPLLRLKVCTCPANIFLISVIIKPHKTIVFTALSFNNSTFRVVSKGHDIPKS